MIRTLPALALAALVLAAPAALAQADRPVARIDGLTITERDVQIATEDLAERLAQVPEARRRDFVIEYLGDLKLGARAAERAKVQDAAEFQARLAYIRQKTLLEEFLNREAAKAVNEAAARKLYDETVKGMTPEEEVRARHILVEKEDEAKAALARVRAGEDFAKVSSELSRDPGSKANGGDLGYFTKDRMVPQFGAAAFQLKVGEVSAPVQTQFGWHIIKVEDKRSRALPSFEQVRGEIEDYLKRKAQQDTILALRGQNRLERLDQPAQAPAQTPAQAPAPVPARP
jgi:peptidyl-prolyl cis-trans isomerase C